MALSRSEVKKKILADLSRQFQRPAGDFEEKHDLRTIWYFTDKALREWCKDINKASWFKGWIAVTEMIECTTIGDVIDLVHDTQGRTKPKDLEIKYALNFVTKYHRGESLPAPKPPVRKIPKKAQKRGDK